MRRNDLPAAVQAALAAGRKIEAIRLLRDATGLSLADAKAAVERGAVSPAAPITGGLAGGGDFGGALPPQVAESLSQGRKVEAIKLLRQSTGIGLKEAKARIDAHEAGSHPALHGLSPGEVPRRPLPPVVRRLIGVAAVLAVAYAYLRLR